MMDNNIRILLNYPLLLPRNENLDDLDGYINVNGLDYKVHVQKVAGKVRLVNEARYAKRLQNKYNDIFEFLTELHRELAAITVNTSANESRNPTDRYRRVLAEYIEFRNFRIDMKTCTLSSDLNTITCTTADQQDRIHSVTIFADYEDESVQFSIVNHSLPEKTNTLTSNASLCVVYNKFLALVQELQMFLDLMENFDNFSQVMDPKKPTTKDVHRCISVDCDVSIVVTVNPWACDKAPGLQFLGPERFVECYRSKVTKNLPDWNLKGNPFEELLKLLELETFPHQQKDAANVVLYDRGECCICFSYKLNEKLPKLVCKNIACEQFFHVDCLYQWLVTLGAKVKRSFNEMHGKCPNCEKDIFCPIP
ncbi:hypothetical protein FQA39_LY14228 [Lamprigera yunnana]|nr:hypothetical protein FQA39_LY14228 [Lamprigera yunnana]